MITGLLELARINVERYLYSNFLLMFKPFLVLVTEIQLNFLIACD